MGLKVESPGFEDKAYNLQLLILKTRKSYKFSRSAGVQPIYALSLMYPAAQASRGEPPTNSCGNASVVRHEELECSPICLGRARRRSAWTKKIPNSPQEHAGATVLQLLIGNFNGLMLET